MHSQNNIATGLTIIKFRELFARYRLPKQVVSENGRQLVSKEFEHFMKVNGIEHITTPPFSLYYNSAAEKSVKTVKYFLLKELNIKKVFLAKFLLTYRNTVLCSPGEPPEYFLEDL